MELKVLNDQGQSTTTCSRAGPRCLAELQRSPGAQLVVAIGNARQGRGPRRSQYCQASFSVRASRTRQKPAGQALPA